MEKIHVTIGQVKIGRAGQSLNAILGSCIGLGFLFPQRGIYGLAHCLLSNRGKVSEEAPGRNIDAAIETLTEMMSLSKSDRRKVRVIVTGGANMTRPDGTDPRRLVGSVNANYALKATTAAGFRIHHNDIGGTLGRQVTINCDDGMFEVAEIPRLVG